jgi:hypothetical protein
MNSEPVKILLCTANAVHPRRRIQLDELRSIEEALQRSRSRECYELRMSLAVSFTKVAHEIDDHEPTIVHFSGHGDPSGNIVLRDDKGGERHIAPSRIADLLGTIPRPPVLVTFATCYSAELAKAAVKHALHSIGFDGPFNDASAPHFSATLYERLAARPQLDVPRAFRLTKIACLAEGHGTVELAQLCERTGGAAASPDAVASPSGPGVKAPALAPALRALVDELARVFWESERAEVLVLRNGLPPQLMPKFNTPVGFWEKLAMEAERGGVPGGLRALGRAAAAMYPGNEIFSRYR